MAADLDSNEDPWYLPEGFELDGRFVAGGVHEPSAIARQASADGLSHRRRTWLPLGFAVAGVLLAIAIGTWLARPGSAPVVRPASPPTSRAGGMTTADQPGTCYTSASPSPSTTLDLTALSCGLPHDFELVAHDSVPGINIMDPTTSYWQGVAGQGCAQALVAYEGAGTSDPTGTITSYMVAPMVAGHPAGARPIYCLAQSRPRTTGSIRAG